MFNKALTRFLLSAATASAALCVSKVCAAQQDPEEEAAGEDLAPTESTTPAEPQDEPMESDEDARNETPGTPSALFRDNKATQGGVPKKSSAASTSEYPMRAVDRPITLPGGMVAVGAAIPFGVNPFGIAATLGGAYGITDSTELGLRYSPGRYSKNFSAGRAFAVDAQYLITDMVAAKISVPLYLDPFALGVVLGAPFNYAFLDRFLLVAGQDILSITLKEFLPSVDNASANDAALALRTSNQIVPTWTLNLSAGVIYQVDNHLAVDVMLGNRFDDTDAAVRMSFDVGLLYAQSNMFDIGARIGASDLANFSKALSLQLFLSRRI